MNQTSRFVWAFVLAVATLSCVAWLIFHVHSVMPSASEQVIEFSSGEFSPENKVSWKSVALPDDWRKRNLPISHAWYRFEFDLDTLPLKLNALYFPTLSQNLAVYLNGVEIGDGGSLQEPVARHWPRPLMFPIAPEFFKTGKNELLIWLVSEPAGRGLLTRFYLGDRDALLGAYSNRANLKVTAPTVFAVGLTVFGMLLISITCRRRKDSQYAWGGISLIGLACHSLPMLLTHSPVSSFFWEWWQHVCIGSTVVAITLFVNRFLSLYRPRIEWAAATIVAVSAVISLLFDVAGHSAFYFRFGGAYWGGLSVLIGVIPLVTLSSAMLKDKDPQKVTLLCAGTLLFFFGAHDELFVMGVLSRQNGYLMHYASPFAALIFTSILFSRFVQASTEVEELNNTLEKRVEQKSRELLVTHEKLRQLEREKLITQERERFNRDMHDGLGGYLANALALAEKTTGQHSGLVTTLKDATEEMRLMIDSAEASGEDIGMIIGTLRPKLERQLNHSGFRLRWNVQETDPIRSLGPASAMQLIRIVQETINNACKHSGGDLVEVSIYNGSAGTVVLEISDNGICRTLSRTGGNGTYNIQTRAEQLEGRATFTSSGKLGGLTVQVSVPTHAMDANHLPSAADTVYH